ncbi:hypothetical protein ZHAS_00015585 [Anopheles sinensis]|uniref:Uncharacterized protein n=1 Tax=Anopheles sinensis TaxID=74873 RepID=A0A084WBL9_ANOSI|nr:hypothetical protein ZHAS_00015585 [Anopheles sinensis]
MRYPSVPLGSIGFPNGRTAFNGQRSSSLPAVSVLFAPPKDDDTLERAPIAPMM